jgi:crotonobetainyl-CoA:carnitine CoA-transferase CaiB-like acyl-CoA transferase
VAAGGTVKNKISEIRECHTRPVEDHRTPPVPLPAIADLRVVEMGVWVAAPGASGILADWGADVIKVEAPGGDPMRGVFGAIGLADDLPDATYALDNRGQRSLVLDLREESTASASTRSRPRPVTRISSTAR